MTPPHWHHVRIEPDADRFRLVTFLGNRFGPIARRALGGHVTEKLTVEEALAIGEKIESQMAGPVRRKRK